MLPSKHLKDTVVTSGALVESGKVDGLSVIQMF